MTDAYVNVIVSAGAVSAAAEEVAAIDEVEAVHITTGEHDLVARLRLDGPDDLPHVVADKIHNVTGVVDTVTNVAYEP